MASESPIDSVVKQAIIELSSNASRIRRRAAKQLRRARVPEACPALIHAVEKELSDPRTWETQYQLIMALGECRCYQALPFLKKLAQKQFEATSIYAAIGGSMVLLSCENGTGVSTVLEILESNNVNFIEGALCAMACSRLRATPEQVVQILRFAKKLPEFSPAEPGFFIRVWIAAAAAGWDALLVKDFLLDCCKSNNQQLLRAAQAALEKRYLKWYPL